MLKEAVLRWFGPFVRLFKDFFDRRFQDTEDRIVERIVQERGGSSPAVSEVLTHLGQRLRQLAEETNAQGARIETLERSLRASVGDRHFDSIRGLDQMEGTTADILNFAESHNGFKAQAGLWFNDPVVLRYFAGGVEIFSINERILEVPYVFSALASLKNEAEVLDVGGCESTVSMSLASLGYRVTQVDLRQQILKHPNLISVKSAIEDWHSSMKFDAIVCLSSIEHFGLGAYGESAREEDSDLQAMRLLWSLAKPEALLVLTAPFGRFEIGATQRVYDLPAVDRLLRGWAVHDLRLGVALHDVGWKILGGRERAAEIIESSGPAVVLLSARRMPTWPQTNA